MNTVIYFFFPETARLSLEEIAQKFGEEVAVHLTDATDEEKAELDDKLANSSGAMFESSETSRSPHGGERAETAPVYEAESKDQNVI